METMIETAFKITNLHTTLYKLEKKLYKELADYFNYSSVEATWINSDSLNPVLMVTQEGDEFEIMPVHLLEFYSKYKRKATIQDIRNNKLKAFDCHN